jgi:uncharacterized protein YecT (DUF1311 family)
MRDIWKRQRKTREELQKAQQAWFEKEMGCTRFG